MMTDYSQFEAICEDDEEEELELVLFLVETSNNTKLNRSSSVFHRQRWESEYLVNLAIQEGTFVSDYRMGPREFDIIHTLIGDRLKGNEQMAPVAAARSEFVPITAASKIGTALILLAGGRRLEAMRTHGIAQATVYSTLHSFCAAINEYPVFDLDYRSDLFTLKRRAKEFYAKSFVSFFNYCFFIINE
jgi:predicted GNAT family acetyltransferase